MPKNGLTDIEKKVLSLVKKHGKKGIYQSDLWKILGISSREASRVLKKLETKGYVRRVEAVKGGRKTFLVYATKKPVSEKKGGEEVVIVKPRINYREFLDIPCMSCAFLNKCYIGGFNDPTRCPWLDSWIEKGARKRRGS